VRNSAILLAKLSQNRIDESEPGNGDRLVQLLLFLELNLLKFSFTGRQLP
jgi:hypothetical protein